MLPVVTNLNQILKETATGYLHLGWSVVPLWGDSKPDQAKVATVAWGPYQRRRASTVELNHWFTGHPSAGLGIVTGAVSQLVVLDFDAPDISKRFAAQYPDLANTRTILTRRGQHLYFHVPPHLRVTSRKLEGVDLLSDGHYVVAPPTVIAGHAYRIGQGGLPKTLDQTALSRIHAFLDQQTRNHVIRLVERPEGSSKISIATTGEKQQAQAFSRQDEPPPEVSSSVTPDEATFLTAEALVTFYRGMARQMKRNVALFKTSCLARDHGWKFEAVVAVLAGVHAAELPTGQHRSESPKLRHREAVRTIRSAFSKPPRPPRPKDSGGLFNSIREKLMQLGQTCVVRVLEGLRLAGLKAGQIVSERTVLQLLKGLVGRHSIRLALAAKTPVGEALFEQVSPSLHSPHCAAATQVRIDRHTNAYVTEKKPDSIRGRPERTFRLPSPQALCERLGVAPSGSDPLDQADLQTAKKTRQALHRELFRRRPGTYLRKWLAERLGVSERTVSSYNRQTSDVHVVPTFTQTPLGWGNLNAIPSPEVALPGTCLEDSTGKRWPALKGIAQKLLGQGRGVRLLVRSLNYYWYGHGDPPADANGLRAEWAVRETIQPETQIPTFRQQLERLVRMVGTQRSTATPIEVVSSTAPRSRVASYPASEQPPPSRKRQRQRRYWMPLNNPQAEALAGQVYQSLNQRTNAPDGRVSRATARRWVDDYGLQAVSDALEILRTRRNITRPAGWFQTLLRSSRIR